MYRATFAVPGPYNHSFVQSLFSVWAAASTSTAAALPQKTHLFVLTPQMVRLKSHGSANSDTHITQCLPNVE